MTWLLSSLPTVVLLLLVVGLSVLLSVSGLLVVRRRISQVVLREHNDVAGFIFATLGVTYAVILGFVAIALWEDFAATESLVQREAATALNIAWGAEAFPEPARTEVQTSIRTYVRLVAQEEWPLMASGESSPRTEQALAAVRSSVLRLEPSTQRENNWHAQLVANSQTLSELREERLEAMGSDVPPILWIVLLLSAIITVSYTYLYGVPNPRSQIIMTAAMSSMIGLALALIVALDHPFTGQTAVSPDAFEAALEAMSQPVAAGES
jgi:uncharacterized protein DUF4239